MSLFCCLKRADPAETTPFVHLNSRSNRASSFELAKTEFSNNPHTPADEEDTFPLQSSLKTTTQLHSNSIEAWIKSLDLKAAPSLQRYRITFHSNSKDAVGIISDTRVYADGFFLSPDLVWSNSNHSLKMSASKRDSKVKVTFGPLLVDLSSLKPSIFHVIPTELTKRKMKFTLEAPCILSGFTTELVHFIQITQNAQPTDADLIATTN